MTANRPNHVEEAEDVLAVVSNLAPTAPQTANALAEAQVHATLALVEQIRIANRLKVAEIDMASEFHDEVASFRIRPYLTTNDWRAIEVPEDDEVNS